MKFMPSWPTKPSAVLSLGGGDTPSVFGSSVPARNTSKKVTVGGVTSIVTGTVSLERVPPGYVSVADTVAGPSLRPEGPRVRFAEKSADPGTAVALPVPITVPAPFFTRNVTPVTAPGARAVAVTCTFPPTNAFAAGVVTTMDGVVTGLQVTVCVSQTEDESQAGEQVEATQTGGLTVLSQRAAGPQSVSLEHWPRRSFCGWKQATEVALTRTVTATARIRVMPALPSKREVERESRRGQHAAREQQDVPGRGGILPRVDPVQISGQVRSPLVVRGVRRVDERPAVKALVHAHRPGNDAKGHRRKARGLGPLPGRARPHARGDRWMAVDPDRQVARAGEDDRFLPLASVEHRRCRRRPRDEEGLLHARAIPDRHAHAVGADRKP